jgi:hypothetical protein
VVLVVGGAQAGDAGRDVEQGLGDPAGAQVGLVRLGDGDQQVGVGGAGAVEDGRRGGVAGDDPQVETLLQVGEALAVVSTTVMSLASETRLSATEVPTWPAPRMMIFIVLLFLGGRFAGRADGAGSAVAVVVALAHADAELLELAVEVGALEAGFSARRVMLLPSICRWCSKYSRSKISRASRSGRSRGRPRAAVGVLTEQMGDFVHVDFFFQGAQGEGLDGGLQLGVAAAPVAVAQGVEGGGAEAAGGTSPASTKWSRIWLAISGISSRISPRAGGARETSNSRVRRARPSRAR